MVKSLRDKSRILKAKVECLKAIENDNNLLKNQFEVLHEENRSLFNMTRSTEQNLEKVQSYITEKFITMEEGTADMDHKLQSLSIGTATLTADIKERFITMEEGTDYLDRKLQSLSVENETLTEKIKTAECDNRILSKACDRLSKKFVNSRRHGLCHENYVQR